MTPNWVNNAYWITKEKRQHFCMLLYVVGPWTNWNGITWGIFPLLIQTLPTFWATPILMMIICILWICLDPRFPGSWISRLTCRRELLPWTFCRETFAVKHFAVKHFAMKHSEWFPKSQISRRCRRRTNSQSPTWPLSQRTQNHICRKEPLLQLWIHV